MTEWHLHRSRLMAVLLPLALVVTGCAHSAGASSPSRSTTTTSSTTTTVPICEVDPYLYGCPLYEPPTTTTLPPPITVPQVPVYNVSQPSYEEQLQQCESQNYAQTAMIANGEFQRTLGRNATPAEVEQVVSQLCQENLASHGVSP